MLTDPIYFRDCYISEFDARVVDVSADRLVLDRTAFYPKGGGQPSDTGTMIPEGTEAPLRVLKVTKEGPTIYHKFDGGEAQAGDKVHCILDWERRYAHMRYHTAQHLLSAHFLSAHGAPTTGNRIASDKGHMDFGLQVLVPEMIARAETEVNAWVRKAIPVKISLLPRGDALRALDPVRTRIDLLPKSVKTLRIVDVEGIDAVACAGTHVANTREVGDLRITGSSRKGKGRSRIEFVLNHPR